MRFLPWGSLHFLLNSRQQIGMNPDGWIAPIRAFLFPGRPGVLENVRSAKSWPDLVQLIPAQIRFEIPPRARREQCLRRRQARPARAARTLSGWVARRDW